ELAVEVFEAHRHFGIADLVPAARIDERGALRLGAEMIDEEAQILLERVGQVDGMDQARLQKAVLDLADRARRHARQLGEAVDRQAPLLAQLAQALADVLDVVFCVDADLERALLGGLGTAAGESHVHGRPMDTPRRRGTARQAAPSRYPAARRSHCTRSGAAGPVPTRCRALPPRRASALRRAGPP